MATQMKAGMFYHPYAYPTWVKIAKKANYPVNKMSRISGGWVHDPFTTAASSFKGANLATTIAQGNYMTRNYRQKPIVGLETATHKYKPPKVLPKPSLATIYESIKPTKSVKVDIPTVSQRRVKKINQNKMLGKVKAMPYRRRKHTKRTSKKKRYSKRRLPPLALPRSRVVRMRAVASSGTTTSGSGLNTLFLKANSLNDPTGLFGAGLPLGLDQWASQYQKYIVLGSKAKIRFIANATNTGAVQVGAHLADNNTALSSSAHYKELPLTRSRLLSLQKDMATITMSYAGKRFWRLNNIKDDSEQEASFSTTPGDPTDLAYYHLFVQDINGSQAASVDIQVELEYIVLLTDPINLAQSSL